MTTTPITDYEKQLRVQAPPAPVFDALTTERPYRKALPHRMAFDVLEEESSRGWRDGALVREFIGIAGTLL